MDKADGAGGDDLKRYADLEMFYDGPIPEMALHLSRHPCPEEAAQARAMAEIVFLTTLARHQTNLIRRQKAAGTCPARHLRADLGLYLRQRRCWKEYAAAIKKEPRNARLQVREEKPEGLTRRGRIINMRPVQRS